MATIDDSDDFDGEDDKIQKQEREQYDKEVRMLRAIVTQLSEHFDTVQIFATKVRKGGRNGTIAHALGTGNNFARTGQIEFWLRQEYAEGTQVAEEEEDDDTDDDDSA